MAQKRRQYSYTTQRNKHRRVLLLILGFIFLFAMYNGLTTFFFSVWVIENNSMQPGLNPGDRLLFTSFALPFRAGNHSVPLRRGNVVLVNRGVTQEHRTAFLLLDSVIRFFTAQRISFLRTNEQHYVKRVIGLPGDEISMSNHIFRIRPTGSAFSFTEFEFMERPYQPSIPQSPELWDESLPFSGTMDILILEPNEFFLASDDRGNTNDSRTWGPVSSNFIAARAVFRFWPLTRISRQ